MLNSVIRGEVFYNLSYQTPFFSEYFTESFSLARYLFIFDKP